MFPNQVLQFKRKQRPVHLDTFGSDILHQLLEHNVFSRPATLEAGIQLSDIRFLINVEVTRDELVINFQIIATCNKAKPPSVRRALLHDSQVYKWRIFFNAIDHRRRGLVALCNENRLQDQPRKTARALQHVYPDLRLPNARAAQIEYQYLRRALTRRRNLVLGDAFHVAVQLWAHFHRQRFPLFNGDGVVDMNLPDFLDNVLK
ncbi:hypothetical protein D3C86_1195270 [compost metagenome]